MACTLAIHFNLPQPSQVKTDSKVNSPTNTSPKESYQLPDQEDLDPNNNIPYKGEIFFKPNDPLKC
jgi:hypothetical protein